MAQSLRSVHIHLLFFIEKDICDCRKVSVKLPYVYVYLSSEYRFIFFVKNFLFILLFFSNYYMNIFLVDNPNFNVNLVGYTENSI